MASEVSSSNEAAAAAPPPAKSPTGRLVSLDAYRGFIMLLLVSEGLGFSVLRNHPGWEWLAGQVDHTQWEGCTFWDLIQPAFTFMVGMAMPFAFAKRKAEGATDRSVFGHVAYRALMLVVLSNVFSNWGPADKSLRLQLINVLSQIAFGYLICFFVMRLRFRSQVITGAAMLAGFWALFAVFPGPEGPWSKVGNIGALVDLNVLGYSYSGYYTTINFIGNAVTILFGCWAGLLVRTGKSHGYKLKVLISSAAAGLVLGLVLQPVNPMIKRLWTCSFTFFSAGWVLLMLAVFYWIVEVKQVKKWTFPLVVVGMNSLFIYSLGQIGIKGWLMRGLGNFTKNFGVFGDVGMIPQHILVMACLWYACYWLYQRKVFFKI